MQREIVFGTMQWGGKSDEKTAAETFHACCAAGVGWFDTAHLYTGGASEEILGRLIAANPDVSIQVATKVAYSGGASAANIRAQFDTSRRRLGLERVACLYLHRFDPETPLEESLTTLAELQAAGAIASIGLSNFAAWQVMKAQAIAARLGTRIGHLQPMYSLVKRQAEVEILPMALDQSIAVHSYSPLGGGLLTGKYASGGSGRLSEDARYARRYGQTALHDAATRLSAIAAELGTHPATLAVAWVARHPGVVPIVSGRDAAQLAPSLAALDFEMDAALHARLSALVPPPPSATDRTEEQALALVPESATGMPSPV
ncbi:MAG: aldo/keto reductase [Pseudomonadota bacterium]